MSKSKGFLSLGQAFAVSVRGVKDRFRPSQIATTGAVKSYSERLRGLSEYFIRYKC